MVLTHLAIGSNSGDRYTNIRMSLKAIEEKIGRIVSGSFIYESQSWGYEGQDFLNMVVKVATTLSPLEILEYIQKIEKEFNRIKVTGMYTDRTIDVDIIFYENKIIKNESLIIPHPHLQNRLFVLIPLLDIDPEYIHPILNKNIKQLRDECKDTGWIKYYGEIKL